MSGRLPVRGSGQARRRSGPRRASARLSPSRAAAALLLVLAAGAAWGLTTSPVFAIRNVSIDGATLTPEAAVRAALALPEAAPNAFSLRTDDLRARVMALPAVAGAEVEVVLADSLRVTVRERVPILAWRTAGHLLLVDVAGRVLADADDESATPAAKQAPTSLATVDDRRTGRAAPVVGGTVDPLELDVARRLLSLRPVDLGSAATGLSVAVDDTDGWLVLPDDSDPWTAVFGIYTTSLRSPQVIPEQVRLLRSLLVPREKRILRVVLAGPESGTFVSR